MVNTVGQHFAGSAAFQVRALGGIKMLMEKIHAVTSVFVVALTMPGLFLADRTASAGLPSVTEMLLIAPTPAPGDKKIYSEYKGVTIGTTADIVRQKLGPPKDKSDAQDLYTFSDNESAVFYYDAAHVVSAIMITYLGNLKDAPSVKDVFGEDVPPKPDGSIFKMVRYPKAGYWISYNRSGGDDAVISLAIQKI